ncbi:MAG: DUF92 domain-containing protein [Anaerolineae bacterium]|nr:DUF92 domain-containing protein [Anaerolineae bacterium]
MIQPIQLLSGIVLSSLIAAVAYRRQALTGSGAVGAVITGSLIFGFGGWPWGMLLITFFVLSTVLSRYRAGTKEQLAEKFAKGSRRDLGQVLANGGLGTLLALAFALFPHSALLFAFSGAMATVNADTWATELGVLAKRPPRLVTTGRAVEPGTSGAISLLGTLATLAGGGTIGAAAAVFVLLDGLWWSDVVGPGRAPIGWLLVATSALGGLAGSLFDSLLGATVQAIYYTRVRNKETERPVDPDGSLNELIRGWRWLNNDWVNFLSSIVGALVSAGGFLLLS